MTQTENRPALPTLALDYASGTFTNTLTGESAHEITAVVLGQRADRTLWDANPANRLPVCVNGSAFGPCLCAFADWGPRGEAPECAEELSVLLWDEEHAQAVVLTARRSMVKVLDQYLGMKALLGGSLHDQRVTIRMTPGDGLHRLTLLPGPPLDAEAQARMGALAERVTASGAFGGLG